MSFYEVEFPRQITFKSVGGPTWKTTVNTGLSGAEQRNSNWSITRNKYTVNLITPTGQQPASYAQLLLAFFNVVRGKGDAFRLYDWNDNTMSPVTIGIANGTTTVFQLAKPYTIGSRTYSRVITKPITSAITDYQGNALPNTVQVFDNSVLTTAYTLDPTTGLITFPTAPLTGHIISAGCQFHIPVRFDSDELPLTAEESDFIDGTGVNSLSQLALIEVRIP